MDRIAFTNAVGITDMSNLITQKRLADLLDYSQSRVSTATDEESALYPDFMDKSVHPHEWAETKGGHLQGYDPSEFPEPVQRRRETDVSTRDEGDETADVESPPPIQKSPAQEASSIQNASQVFLPTIALKHSHRPAYAPEMGLTRLAPNRPPSTNLLSGNDVEMTKNETDVSVLPEGMDVSQSALYISGSYLGGQLAKSNPPVAWPIVNLVGAGTGAYAGYQVDESAGGALAGAAAGVTVTLLSQILAQNAPRSASTSGFR